MNQLVRDARSVPTPRTGAHEATLVQQRTALVPLDRIVPSPSNIRERLRGVEELAAQFREVGVLQAIILTPAGRADGRLTIVDGHRRYAAARLAGLPAIPATARKAATQADRILLMLVAGNHQQVTPLEEGRAYQALRNEQMSVVEIARRTGKSPDLVRSRLLLVDLPEEAQDLLEDGTLNLTDAVKLSRQVRSSGTGQATTAARKSVWLTRTHRLAAIVRELCEHRDVASMIGGVGCGQCWEDAIRADAVQEVRS